MTSLAGKIAIVAGGARGIGAAIAKRLAADGAKVVLSYSQSQQAAAEVVAQIKAEGGVALALMADISNLEQIKQLFKQVKERFDQLDILVNNAGVNEFRPLEEIDVSFYAKLFDVNVRGALFASQEGAHHMSNEGGRIVNISASAARAMLPNMSVYAAPKAALKDITRCYAVELGKRGINVNAVSPGLIEAELMHNIMSQSRMSEEDKEGLIQQNIALGHLGKPEDVADVVAFVVSEKARFVTGQVTGVNGGLHL